MESSLTWNGIISSNVYIVSNRNFHSNVNVDFANSFERPCTDRHCLVYFWNQNRNKNICKLNKGNSRNLSVQRSFLQYKSRCLEKVNVKYVIKRLWHEIFHIVPGINPRPISSPTATRRNDYAWNVAVKGLNRVRLRHFHTL